MGGTLAVATGVATLAVVGVLLVRRTTRRRWVRGLMGAVVVLLVVVGGVQVWARLMLDHSSVARALVWMQADTGDWRRFDSRPFPAGENTLIVADNVGGA